MRLSGPHSWSRRFGEDKLFLAQPRNEKQIFDFPACSQSSQLQTVYSNNEYNNTQCALYISPTTPTPHPEGFYFSCLSVKRHEPPLLADTPNPSEWKTTFHSHTKRKVRLAIYSKLLLYTPHASMLNSAASCPQVVFKCFAKLSY